MDTRRGSKRAAAEQKEREASPSEEKATPVPAVPRGPLERLFELPELFGLVQDYAWADDLARLREESAVARPRLLAVPAEAKMQDRPAPDPEPAGYVDPEVAAVPYAMRLLAKPYVREFLTHTFFPAERAVMHWAFEDADVAALLDRGRHIERDARGNVLYPGEDSVDMFRAEKAVSSSQRLRNWVAYTSREEHACPSNALWARCFARFTRTCGQAVWNVLQGLEALNYAARFSNLAALFETDITQLYRAALRTLVELERQPRTEAQNTRYRPRFGFMRIFGAREPAAPGSDAAEDELRTLFLTAGQESTRAAMSFETFARVLLPALFRTFRARLVFMHAWFPFTDVVRTAVYAARGVQPPRTMYVLGEGSFDPSRDVMCATWAWWTRVGDGSPVLFGPRVDDEEGVDVLDRLEWQYLFFEAHEFGCAIFGSPDLEPVAAPELPAHRLTADAVVRVARALCVGSNYRRLQRELLAARGRDGAQAAVQQRADALFATDAMFSTDERFGEDELAAHHAAVRARREQEFRDAFGMSGVPSLPGASAAAAEAEAGGAAMEQEANGAAAGAEA